MSKTDLEEAQSEIDQLSARVEVLERAVAVLIAFGALQDKDFPGRFEASVERYAAGLDDDARNHSNAEVAADLLHTAAVIRELAEDLLPPS